MNSSPAILDRLAVFTAMAPDWSPRQTLEHLHARGVRRVEWAAHYPPGQLPLAAPWHLDLTPQTGNARVLRDLCQEFGIEVACLSGTAQLRDDESPRRMLDAARCLGCPMVRLGTTGFIEAHAPREAPRATADRLRHWVPLARQSGVKLLVEIHAGCVTSSPELAWRVVDGFDPRDVGVILDPGNMTLEGMTAWPVAIGLLGEYLAHVHVKNLRWSRGDDGGWRYEYTALGEGLVDWAKVVDSLEASGYGGLYSFEDFRGGYCRVPQGITTGAKLDADVAFLSDALARAGARTMTSKGKS